MNLIHPSCVETHSIALWSTRHAPLWNTNKIFVDTLSHARAISMCNVVVVVAEW